MRSLIAIAALLVTGHSFSAPIELRCVRATDEGDAVRWVTLDPETETVEYAKNKGKFKECKKVQVSDAAVKCKTGTSLINGLPVNDSINLDRYTGVLTVTTRDSMRLYAPVEYHYDCSIIERAEKKF